MKYKFINENNKPQRLNVRFSDEITNKIDDISFENQFETEQFIQWHDYIEGLKNWVSNPTIAWDNQNIYEHYIDGTTHKIDNGYDVSFVILEDVNTRQNFIYIFDANLKIEEYGLTNLLICTKIRNAQLKKYIILKSQNYVR